MEGTALPISAAGIIGYETVYGNGLLQVATFGQPGTYVIAQYDGRDVDLADQLVDSEDLGPVDLTDGGTNTKFRLRFNSVDGGNATSLELSITVVGGGSSSTAVQGLAVPEASNPFDFDVPFADFPNSALLASAESITLKFNALATPVPNVDFELDSVEAIPEPATLVMLLGLGVSMLVAAGWCWRKRSN